MDMQQNPWQINETAVQYENKWIRVTEHQVTNPSGGKGIYGVVHFKNIAIGVVALDAQQHIYLVGQFRFPLEAFSWEIPEGGGPVGEDPLLSAQRELLEETGYTFTSYEYLGKISANPSTNSNLMHMYLARGGKKVAEQHLDANEEIKISLYTIEEVKEMLRKNEILQAMHVTCLMYALEKLKG